MVSSIPAPFVITAIGDANNDVSILNLQGGVKDMLVSENVQFSLEEKDELIINAILNN